MREDVSLRTGMGGVVADHEYIEDRVGRQPACSGPIVDGSA
jgi:hypothetical protein